MRIETFNRNTITHAALLLLLFVATGLMVLIRFGVSYPNFPDSLKYLQMVEFFSGTLPLSMTQAPFNFRVMLPAIVFLLPADSELCFSLINYFLLFPLALIMYLIPR